MPSKTPRVAVPRDADLDRALVRTRNRLTSAETRSAAAQVRALALRGARALDEERPDPEAELLERLRTKHGARPATGDLLDLGVPPGEVDPDDPTPATDALNWARGD